MSLNSDLGWIVATISLLISILSIMYAYGKRSKRIDMAVSKVEKLKPERFEAVFDRVSQLNTELYDQSTHLPVYKGRAECLDEREECRARLCNTINYLRNDFREFTVKNETRQGVINGQYLEIQKSISKLETKLENVEKLEPRVGGFENRLIKVESDIKKTQIGLKP